MFNISQAIPKLDVHIFWESIHKILRKCDRWTPLFYRKATYYTYFYKQATHYKYFYRQAKYNILLQASHTLQIFLQASNTLHILLQASHKLHIISTVYIASKFVLVLKTLSISWIIKEWNLFNSRDLEKQIINPVSDCVSCLSSNLPFEPHHKKTCFCHMWTTKAQISLRIRAIWSAPLLFAAWMV